MKRLFLLSALSCTTPLLAAPVVTPKATTAPKATTPKVSPPKAATPKIAPKVAAPKIVKPKAATPKIATPKIATPRVVAPKVATPKVATPKVIVPKATTPKPNVVAPKPGVKLPAAPTKPSSVPKKVTQVIPKAAEEIIVVKGEKLPNGVQFITRPDKIAPVAAISLVIRAGASDESPQNAGWRRFLVGAMLRGVPQGFEPASTDAALQLNEALPRAAEKLGGSIGATVGDDFIEIYVVGQSEKMPELLDLALALWQKPRLSTEDLIASRESSQGQIDADNLDTASKTQAALRSQLFRNARGELSAYGLPDYGTSESLASLTDEKLRALHASKVVGARVTVAATGNFDTSALRAKLAALPARMTGEPAAPSFVAPKSVAALVVRELPIPSAWVFISYPLTGDTKADAPALRVLASALGDSGVARLPNRLLKNQPIGSQPIAISVAAQFIPRRYAGELVVFAQTGPQSVERVKNALLDEIRKLRETPLPKSELQSAKTYARGSWSLERQNPRERAFQTALSPALGGPFDTTFPVRLESVTSAQVQQAAKKYLKSYAVALVMPGD